MNKNKLLLLENQLCFPLYATSRMITQLYTPLLDQLDITYPQYLVLLVLWEKDKQSVSEICKLLYLESNTLTPLLKRMEQKKLITRKRSAEDERSVIISLTGKGEKLRVKAVCIPQHIIETLSNGKINQQEVVEFKNTLLKLLGILSGSAGEKAA